MGVTFYRHRLPHLRVDGAIYFVTWRLGRGQADLSERERDCIVDSIRHFDRTRYALHAYVIMNDHIHVLLRPSDGHQLEEILRSWKSFTANRLRREFGRTGVVWQDEYFDRAVRDEVEYVQKTGLYTEQSAEALARDRRVSMAVGPRDGSSVGAMSAGFAGKAGAEARPTSFFLPGFRRPLAIARPDRRGSGW